MTLPPLSRRSALALAAIAAAAAALRAPGLWTELWVDEIWNWNIARAFSAADILLRVPYDANHILNSLVLHWVGVHEWWGAYRLHSFAAGVATVLLTGWVAAPWGAADAVAAAGLATLSYPLCVYSSEARGHALMVAFALGAFCCLRRWLETKDRRAYAGWAASVVAGFLSQLLFLQAYAGLAAWSALRLASGRARRRAAAEWLAIQTPGIVSIAFLYWVQVRSMRHAGGPALSGAAVLSDTLSAAFGTPGGLPSWFAGAVVLGAAAWAASDLRRRGRDEWAALAAIGVAAPAALLALHPPGLLYPRYFLVDLAFLLPLAAHAAAFAWRRRGSPRALAALVLAAYAAGSLYRLGGFLRDGRGRYVEALRYIAEESGGASPTVGGAHDFATRMMIDFYAPRFPATTFRYVPRGSWTALAPEWVIVNEGRHDFDPPRRVTALTGARYAFARTFRYSDQSGWDWHLYRLVARGKDGLVGPAKGDRPAVDRQAQRGPVSR